MALVGLHEGRNALENSKIAHVVHNVVVEAVVTFHRQAKPILIQDVQDLHWFQDLFLHNELPTEKTVCSGTLFYQPFREGSVFVFIEKIQKRLRVLTSIAGVFIGSMHDKTALDTPSIAYNRKRSSFISKPEAMRRTIRDEM